MRATSIAMPGAPLVVLAPPGAPRQESRPAAARERPLAHARGGGRGPLPRPAPAHYASTWRFRSIPATRRPPQSCGPARPRAAVCSPPVAAERGPRWSRRPGRSSPRHRSPTPASPTSPRAGVASGTFYTYFDSKEEIFREVAAGVLDAMLWAPVRDRDRSERDPIRPSSRRAACTSRPWSTTRWSPARSSSSPRSTPTSPASVGRPSWARSARRPVDPVVPGQGHLRRHRPLDHRHRPADHDHPGGLRPPAPPRARSRPTSTPWHARSAASGRTVGLERVEPRAPPRPRPNARRSAPGRGRRGDRSRGANAEQRGAGPGRGRLLRPPAGERHLVDQADGRLVTVGGDPRRLRSVVDSSAAFQRFTARSMPRA